MTINLKCVKKKKGSVEERLEITVLFAECALLPYQQVMERM